MGHQHLNLLTRSYSKCSGWVKLLAEVTESCTYCMHIFSSFFFLSFLNQTIWKRFILEDNVIRWVWIYLQWCTQYEMAHGPDFAHRFLKSIGLLVTMDSGGPSCARSDHNDCSDGSFWVSWGCTCCTIPSVLALKTQRQHIRGRTHPLMSCLHTGVRYMGVRRKMTRVCRGCPEQAIVSVGKLILVKVLW